MSCMRCCKCERIVDTDEDLDSLYVIEAKDDCVCQWCRDELNLKTEFE